VIVWGTRELGLRRINLARPIPRYESEDRLEALRGFGVEHGRHIERTHNLRRHVVDLNASPSGLG
jgi:hypothetical protein